MKVLITGSTGFIGASVGNYTAAAGHEVLGVGRAVKPGDDWLGSYQQLDLKTDQLSQLVRDWLPDAVFHAAGPASVISSLNDPLTDFHDAAVTCAHFFDAVRRSGHRPLIVIPSSAAVYGDPVTLPVNEEAELRPISPYGFHKVACELLAREAAQCFAQDVLICRFFSVFGLRQQRLLVWELYRQLLSSDETISLAGTGDESRDFLHIDDLAVALLQLIEGLVANPKSGRCLTLNVASGEETSVRRIAELARGLLGATKQFEYQGTTRPGDPLRWRADITRLRSFLPAWQPAALETALRQCLGEWQKEGARSAHGS